MSMTEQMFADARTSTERGDRLEMLKSALNASIERADARKGRFVMKEGAGQRVIGHADNELSPDRLAAVAEQFAAFSKGLDESQQAQVSAALAELNAMKDITAGQYPGVGSPGNLKPYDLEAPAKILVPRFTPLVNELPRTKGQGGAREYRRILGYTNTGMGGIKDQDIFFNSESDSGTPSFGALALRRGQKISYAMDVQTVAYVEASVSDMVTYKVQFQNLGFENSRALSKMALLWAHKLGEEKAMLYGRGNSSQGYAGPLGGTSAATVAAIASGGNFASGSYTAVITARAGVGETAQGTPPTAVAVVANGGLAVTVPALPAGAAGFNIYVGLSGGPYYYAGFTSVGSTTVNILSQPATTAPQSPGATDSTASNGYDGLLTVLTGSNSGYYSSSPSAIATNGDKFIQDATLGLYQGVYADPDEVWMNVAQAKELGDWLKQQGTATSYRIDVANQNAATLGAIVTGVYNESSPTRKMLDLRVHPYMPTGCAIVRSRTLDIPDSGIGDTTQVVSVQEYMAVDWPEIQFTYDSSTYWMGTLIHYAPKWSGAVTGLA